MENKITPGVYEIFNSPIYVDRAEYKTIESALVSIAVNTFIMSYFFTATVDYKMFANDLQNFLSRLLKFEKIVRNVKLKCDESVDISFEIVIYPGKKKKELIVTFSIFSSKHNSL